MKPDAEPGEERPGVEFAGPAEPPVPAAASGPRKPRVISDGPTNCAKANGRGRMPRILPPRRLSSQPISPIGEPAASAQATVSNSGGNDKQGTGPGGVPEAMPESRQCPTEADAEELLMASDILGPGASEKAAGENRSGSGQPAETGLVSKVVGLARGIAGTARKALSEEVP